MFLFGSIVEREDPRDDPVNSFTNYKNLLAIKSKYSYLISPFDNLWSVYNS